MNYDGMDPAVVDHLKLHRLDIDDCWLELRDIQSRIQSNPELDQLRDRFAMAALTGLETNPGCNDWTMVRLAERAFKMADAMLAAREVTP